MEYQLRMYRVKPGLMDTWVSEWRERVYPLRRQYGFEVHGAWVLPEDNRFVWILGYAGADGFAARDAAYYASPERADMDPEPARHLDQVETWMMSSVLPAD